MGFQQIGSEPLDAVIHIRVTNDEKDMLKADADMASMSVSALIRARYFGRPIVASADAAMIKELRRIGGLLKNIHNESNGANAQGTAAVLGELRAYINKLSAK